jgi:hypothetical protein
VSETATPIANGSARPRTKIGAYSRRGALALLDGRSKEAIFLKRRREELVAHCGGSPTIAQLALIERCCWLSLRLAQLDAKVASGDLTLHDSNVYIAWSNALGRALERLGIKGAPAKSPGQLLDEHTARIAARSANGGGA